MIDDQTFAEGNMGDIRRRGDRVIRGHQPWNDAVRSVLRHLEQQGFPYSPRLLAEGDTSDEVSFIDGESVPPELDGYESDDTVVQIGRMTRAYHDAMDGFRLPRGISCVPMEYAPEHPDIICHTDIAPWNTIARDGHLVALIDFDLVSPGTRRWDLAYASWRWAPIYPPGERTSFSAEEQARRARLLFDAYGLTREDRCGMTDLMERRIRSSIDTVEVLGRQGVPGFVRLYEGGHHLSGHDDLAWFRQNQSVFFEAIELA